MDRSATAQRYRTLATILILSMSVALSGVGGGTFWWRRGTPAVLAAAPIDLAAPDAGEAASADVAGPDAGPAR